jgi:hypothetical protein
VTWFVAFLTLRLGVAAVCLLTVAYATAVASPFAFDMFIRPQLFPWLTTFVAWHHCWFAAAYIAGVLSIAPELRRWRAAQHAGYAEWAALGYVIAVGLVAAYLMIWPYLPTLWSQSRLLTTTLISLLPLMWLSAVDHAATWRVTTGGDGHRQLIGQRRLLFSCIGAATYIWMAHFVSALGEKGELIGALPWIVTGAWALALDVTAAMFVYVCLSLIAGIASSRAGARSCEYGLTVAFLAAGLSALVRLIVLPALSLDSSDATPVAVVAGITLAALWSGLAMRRPQRADERHLAGVELLLTPRRGGPWVCIGALVVLAVVVRSVLSEVERLDWDSIIQSVVIIGEWTLAFGLLLRLSTGLSEAKWSGRLLILPPLLALAWLYAIPHVAVALSSSTGDARLEPHVAQDRYAAVDPSFRLAASLLLEQTDSESDYYQALQRIEAAPRRASVAKQSIDFSDIRESHPGPRPHVFLFVIDSLRRDYLSMYNPQVTFTPSLADFARESFVFTNAFTRYGGTWLAMPSIWAGGPVTREWSAGDFWRLNALEKLVVADGYRLVINDYTVAQHLRASTPLTWLDPQVPSVDTDFCHLVDSLESHLEASRSDPRPVFTFLAPMNVHILNTGAGQQPAASDGGLYAPYATRLQRLDACFGHFIANLKRRGLYDNSIIVVTSDHGDSLGEGGNWGHQFFLFPEDVRLPLIVHLPEAVRRSQTTDLGRIAFTTDITPTLYSLLGHQVRKPTPLFGEPLFVRADDVLSPRRRESFLLMSSYGATYGLLRGNGRLLYVSDRMKGREYHFDLTREPLGERLGVSDSLRRANQLQIQQQLAAVAAFYDRDDAAAGPWVKVRSLTPRP